FMGLKVDDIDGIGHGLQNIVDKVTLLAQGLLRLRCCGTIVGNTDHAYPISFQIADPGSLDFDSFKAAVRLNQKGMDKRSRIVAHMVDDLQHIPVVSRASVFGKSFRKNSNRGVEFE